MPYRIHPDIKHNAKIEKHINNGFRFALVLNNKIIAVKRIRRELDLLNKSTKGSEIKELESMLKKTI